MEQDASDQRRESYSAGDTTRVRKNRCRFTPTDDLNLRQIVAEFYRLYREPHWNEVASQMHGKTARQCRERYRNYLSPRVSNRPWTPEEEELLEQKYAEYGPHWARMVAFFPNRSDVHLKNHWSTLRNRKSKFAREELESKNDAVSESRPVTQSKTSASCAVTKGKETPVRLFDRDLMDPMEGDVFCSVLTNWLG
jgi:hypothetical protein